MWKFSRCLLAIPLVLFGATGCAPGDDQAQIASFNEMARDPDRALDMLYPDGVVEPGTSQEAIQLIRDNEWTDNEFDALANMLDAAATAHRTKDDPRAELSALAATDTINLLGQRDNLPDTGNDSLGHLLANYIIDVDLATGNDLVTLEYLGAVFEGLPPGAQFDRESLDVVLSETLTDTQALQVVMDAANQFESNRLAGAIDSGGEPALTNVVVLSNCELSGHLIQSAGFDADPTPGGARATAMAEVISDAIDAQPVAGARFADFLNGDVIKRGGNVWDRKPGSDRPDSDPPRDFIWHAESVMEKSVGVQLGEAGLLPDNNPLTGERFPWVVDGTFDRELALSGQNVAEFTMQLRADSNYQDIFLTTLPLSCEA